MRGSLANVQDISALNLCISTDPSESADSYRWTEVCRLKAEFLHKRVEQLRHSGSDTAVVLPPENGVCVCVCVHVETLILS